MYIALCGNTGVGKSTLGAYLCKELRQQIPIEYVDERPFHHELLQEMFNQPREYSFLIQINFLLQRTLKIKYLTENKRVFLMERSLDEDLLFAHRHNQLKNINFEEFKFYREFWENCLNKVPYPSLYIYLYSDDPLLLTKRVIAGYEQGKRNKELPDNELKEYVTQMNILYDEWFENLDRNKIKVPIFNESTKHHTNFTKLIDSILSLMNSDSVKY